MACDLDTTIEASCESGIGKIQDKILLLKLIAQLTCEIADSGGGGGGGATIVNSSPQGVVVAAAGTLYWDATNKVLWVNETGLINGWWQIV